MPLNILGRKKYGKATGTSGSPPFKCGPEVGSEVPETYVLTYVDAPVLRYIHYIQPVDVCVHVCIHGSMGSRSRAMPCTQVEIYRSQLKRELHALSTSTGAIDLIFEVHRTGHACHAI